MDQTTRETKRELRAGSVGLIGATVVGVAMLSPAMAIYLVFGPNVLYAGKAAPLVFCLALAATLPTALSYALVARELPSSGSAYAWATSAINARVGAWVGWITAVYYTTNVVLQPITFGLFSRDLLDEARLPSGFGGWLIGALLSTAVAGFIVYRGIQPSTHGALAFLFVEMTVVSALALTVVWVVGRRGGLDIKPFLPSSSPQGTGIFQALVFALLAFCGFDVVSTVAEEAKAPRTLIPKATILALLVFGAFVIGNTWAFTFSKPVEAIAADVERGVLPITLIAEQYWGRGHFLIVLTGLSATMGVYLAVTVGASRVLFAMGRDGLLASGYGSVHTITQAPSNALHLVFGVGLAGAVVGVLLLGAYPAYLWWGAASVFFAMLTFLAANVTNFLYYYRFRRERFHPFWNGVVPGIGGAIDLYVLYKSFFRELLSQDWKHGKSVVVVSVGVAVLALWKALRLPAGAPTPAPGTVSFVEAARSKEVPGGPAAQ